MSAATLALLWAGGGVLAILTGVLARNQMRQHVAIIAIGVGALVVAAWLHQRRHRPLTNHEQDIIAWVATGGIGAGIFIAGDTWATAYLPLVIVSVASKASFLTLPKTVGQLGVDSAFLAAAAGSGIIGWHHAVVTVAAAALLALSVSRTRQQLADTLSKLDEERAWQQAIVAAVAHDVRSPLTSIIGSLQVLTSAHEQLPDDTHDKLLAASYRQARRIDQITRDLLDAERVRDGNLHLDRVPVDISKLLADVVAATEIDVELDISGSPVADADRARLDQIMSNLLTNAQRHGEPPIIVSARSDGDIVTVLVTDHGPGVPDGQLPVLFDRFGPGRSKDSVGLGLWIVKLLLDAHNGTISYTNAGPGACFEVVLPEADTTPTGDPQTTDDLAGSPAP